jgi:6-pyruvoyltetrahydropterin/6-carboxytetrahydropterin synthase
MAIEAEGDLNDHGYVIDFIALLEIGRQLVAHLDHRMLLPDGRGLIKLLDDGPNWRVKFDERFWSFPKTECVVLPISNTTTELIASWAAVALRDAMNLRGIAAPRVLRIEVEENVGQSAWVELHESQPG